MSIYLKFVFSLLYRSFTCISYFFNCIFIYAYCIIQVTSRGVAGTVWCLNHGRHSRTHPSAEATLTLPETAADLAPALIRGCTRTTLRKTPPGLRGKWGTSPGHRISLKIGLRVRDVGTVRGHIGDVWCFVHWKMCYELLYICGVLCTQCMDVFGCYLNGEFCSILIDL